jgi:hypothetical protein
MGTIFVPGAGVAVTEVFTNIGGAVAGDIMRANGAGILAAAQNDTIANASKIRGVWNGSRLCRTGEVAIVNFANQPVVDTACYLSGTAKLATMTAPTASVVPRKIGRVTQVLSASQAYVELSIDEDRDNDKLWTILDTTVADTPQTQNDHTINLAVYNQLVLEVTGWGKLNTANSVTAQADGAAGTESVETYETNVASVAGANRVWYGGTGASAAGSTRATVEWRVDGSVVRTSTRCSTSGVSIMRTYGGTMPKWTGYVRLLSGAADMFAVGCRMLWKGKVNG